MRNFKALLATILVYLVTKPNILAVYPTPLVGVLVGFSVLIFIENEN